MKLAAQLYTVRDFCKNQADIEETLKKVKAMGYNSVQVSGFGEFDPYWLGDKVKELGLEICASHTVLDRLVDDTDAVIKEHQAWNCKYIGLGYAFRKNYTKDDLLALFAKLDAPIKRMADSGMTFLFHNHDREFERTFEGKTGNCLEYLAGKYTAEQVGFLLDFYWTEYAGINAFELIDEYADRLKVVHFKDLRINEQGEKQMTEVGNGIVDYKKIYDRLRSTPTEFVAVEQDRDWTVNPFESLKTSYAYLRKTVDEMEEKK